MLNSKYLFRNIVCLALAAAVFKGVASERVTCSEPNIEMAKLWWPDERNVFTPVGWKDHYFRFNVIYNGTIIFEPYSDLSSRLHARKFKGDDFQVTFTAWPDTNTPPLPDVQTPLWKIDGGHGLQGWRTNCETPVLWTDFPCQEGLVIREEVFAHLSGGKEVVTGLEPLYAWIRLSVVHVDPLRAPKEFPMVLQLSRDYHTLVGRFLNENGVTIDVVPDRAPYSRSLQQEATGSPDKPGMQILEPDGRTRFGVLPTSKGRLAFYERAKGIYGLKIDMLANVGDHVDLLMPMFPESREQFNAEESLGFDGALAESEKFWSCVLAHSTHFHVPEEYINQAILQNVKFAALDGEKDYETGEYSFLTGSWGYDELWPTPVSMNSHMFLSLLGYHDMVSHYSDIFRLHQGTVKPPGPSYSLDPGYFGSPKNLTAIDWLSDNGAVLLQVSKEALLSGDKQFIERWTDPIIKSCDFIKNASMRTNHDGVVGLLPPAVATDDGIPTQAIWNLGWNYKGLTEAVQFLKSIHHSRAQEFDDFARKYKATFVKAYRQASAFAPSWTNDDNVAYPKPPTTLSSKPMPFHVYSDAFYLDTGPMFLVWAGLLDADDPLMKASVQFFREGPNWKLKGPRFNAISRPVLEHEVSTCEPCYSWNTYHSWQLGDRQHFLEGMYSLFTAAVSQQTFSGSEHRTGIADLMQPVDMGFSLARLALIDDEIKPRELHLLRICPLAWLSSDEETVCDNMPTIYGPVSLRFKKSRNGNSLDITFRGEWREKPKKVVIHVPPDPGMKRVNVNGVDYSANDEIVLKSF